MWEYIYECMALIIRIGVGILLWSIAISFIIALIGLINFLWHRGWRDFGYPDIDDLLDEEESDFADYEDFH